MNDRYKETKTLTIEERLIRIERALGFVEFPPIDVDEWLKTPEAQEEFQEAFRRFNRNRKDIKPFNDFLKKTGGRVPRPEDD